MSFDGIRIEELENSDSSQLDQQDFGVVRMNHDGNVTDYNKWQAIFSGMSKESVLGKHFFSQVAPCTNNFLVSQKFERNQEIDEAMDYTFTVQMAPTPVKLRLLKNDHCQYLLCCR